jgi:hypothetical protein
VPNVLLAHMSFWTYLMELLGDIGHMESRFSPFRDSVSVDAHFGPFGDSADGTSR